MRSSSTNPPTRDVVDGVVAVAAGVGIVTLALFPLAIPILALTAAALVPLLSIPFAAGLVAAPFLLFRRLSREAARASNGGASR